MKNTQLRKDVESIMKSFELEGFVYTTQEKDIFEKIASGEITPAQARDIFKGMP